MKYRKKVAQWDNGGLAIDIIEEKQCDEICRRNITALGKRVKAPTCIGTAWWSMFETLTKLMVITKKLY